ncbi:Rhomboid-related protein 1 [Schistosoma japonicum]|nr:Rhomboid-related protein 1 [Schistosoma japonicum]KAH8854198.1 Rhomboid-related protein 1 [Schistosoma japonicum]
MNIEECDRICTSLNKKFKPTFDQYESSKGIPLSELKKLLQDSELPKCKIHKIVNSADVDGDRRITYNEFLNQVLSEDEGILNKLNIGERVLNRAMLLIAPDYGREHQRSVAVDSGYDNIDGNNWSKVDFSNYVMLYNCFPPPLFILTITALQIGIFIYYALTSSGVPIHSVFIYDPKKRYELWRFLTYMFIHDGYMHLVFNCFVQLVLGVLLELVHKIWRVGLVYLLGVIAGSLAHSVSDPFVLLAGASGGCYALIGAHLASVILNWDLMQKGWLKDPLKFISSGVVRLTIIMILAGSDTGLAIYARFTNSEELSKIGFTAHFGGLITGLLSGVVILRNFKVEKWEKVLSWICIIIFILFTTAAILFNVFCSESQECPVVLYT